MHHLRMRQNHRILGLSRSKQKSGVIQSLNVKQSHHDVEPWNTSSLMTVSQKILYSFLAYLFILLVEHRNDENETRCDTRLAHSCRFWIGVLFLWNAKRLTQKESKSKEGSEVVCWGLQHEDYSPYNNVGAFKGSAGLQLMLWFVDFALTEILGQPKFLRDIDSRKLPKEVTCN